MAKMADRVRVRLEQVLRRPVAAVLGPAARQLRHDLDLPAGAPGVVFLDDLLEPFHAQDARLDELVVDDRPRVRPRRPAPP